MDQLPLLIRLNLKVVWLIVHDRHVVNKVVHRGLFILFFATASTEDLLDSAPGVIAIITETCIRAVLLYVVGDFAISPEREVVAHLVGEGLLVWAGLARNVLTVGPDPKDVVHPYSNIPYVKTVVLTQLTDVLANLPQVKKVFVIAHRAPVKHPGLVVT